MPAWATGNAGAVGVFLLVATQANQCRDASAAATANDICKVAVAIVTLLRIVGCGVTVDAPG